MRYRTWRKIRLLRPGDWELPVYYENEDGIAEVDRINLHVKSLVSEELERKLSFANPATTRHIP